MGIDKIEGPSNPEIGQPVTYKLKWLAGTRSDMKKPENIGWKLFKKDVHGKYTIIPDGTKEGIDEFTFTFKQIAIGKVYRLEAYLITPKQEEPTAIYIAPQSGSPKLIAIELLDINHNKLSSHISYGQTFVVQVHCINIKDNEKVRISILEKNKKPLDLGEKSVVGGKVTMEISTVFAFSLNGAKQIQYQILAEYEKKKYYSSKVDIEVLNKEKVKEWTNEIVESVKIPFTVVADVVKDFIMPKAKKPAVADDKKEDEKEDDEKDSRKCFCNRNRKLSVDELKDIVKTVTGSEDIWEGKKGEPCPIIDKSYESLVEELNNMFKEYNIHKCIQKISFLAQVSAETGLFRQSYEEKSKYLSSKSFYKGRGLIQLTGKDDGTGLYNLPGTYKGYANHAKNPDIVKNPSIIEEDVHYTVDSAGWEWSVDKKCPRWSTSDKNEAKRWKANYFKKGLGKSLNDIAILMEEEEDKYFYLQSKLLNGYDPNHKLNVDPNGWLERKTAFQQLKDWFKYDKNICNEEAI